MVTVRPNDPFHAHIGEYHGYPGRGIVLDIIDFSLGLDGATSLILYDGAGRAVARLVDEHLAAGSYRVNWDASGFPSGTYRYRLVSGVWSAEGTMVLRK